VGRVNTITRGGSRYYVEPESGAKVPGVTSIIGMLPKRYLMYWAAKLVAETAVEQAESVLAIRGEWDPAARRYTGDPGAAVDMLKGAPHRYTKSRADIGSAAHDMFERMLRGEDVRRVGMDLEPYRRGFAEFLDKVQPGLVSAEDVMWSDTYQYAGSADAILRIWDEDAGAWLTVICDWKTSKESYPDVALQLTAYSRADRLITPDWGVPADAAYRRGGGVAHYAGAVGVQAGGDHGRRV